MPDFMKAKINSNKIYLDDTELKCLYSYRLEKESLDEPSKLTVTLYVDVKNQDNF